MAFHDVALRLADRQPTHMALKLRLTSALPDQSVAPAVSGECSEIPVNKHMVLLPQIPKPQWLSESVFGRSVQSTADREFGSVNTQVRLTSLD
jgi:hypothetical protein